MQEQIPLLVVGLGNPGSKYAGTRHNVGFQVVDRLARLCSVAFSDKFRSQWAEATHQNVRFYLMKPQTFMNLSGEAVGEAVRFYKWESRAVLAVSDDLDLPLGQPRLRLSGGSGGHNGLKSMIEHLGTEDFPRLRIGIGRGSSDSSDHVLGKISKSEAQVLNEAVEVAAKAILDSLTQGLSHVMNGVNQKRDEA